jgi:S1-C subfamily serine protease
MLGAALPAQDGALVFSIDGRFTGMTVVEQAVPALARPPALLAQADRLSRGSPPPPLDLGVEVQELTPALATATGATSGVVVTHVHPRGPAAGKLAVTDVLHTLGDQPITSPDGLRVLLSRVSPGVALDVRLIRSGKSLDASLVPVRGGEAATGTGLVLRGVPRQGAAVVEVRPGSPASLAGIRAGDLVAYLGREPAPAPARVTRAFQELERGGTLVLGLWQPEGHRVVVLRKP